MNQNRNQRLKEKSEIKRIKSEIKRIKSVRKNEDEKIF